MALGTNYKRNSDRNEKRIEKNMARAKELAKELGSLDLAAKVVLGKITIEDAKALRQA
jgi:hypothetical protein